MKNKPSLEEQLRRAVIEKMWLTYFNDSLLAQRIIPPKTTSGCKARLSSASPCESDSTAFDGKVFLMGHNCIQIET